MNSIERVMTAIRRAVNHPLSAKSNQIDANTPCPRINDVASSVPGDKGINCLPIFLSKYSIPPPAPIHAAEYPISTRTILKKRIICQLTPLKKCAELVVVQPGDYTMSKFYEQEKIISSMGIALKDLIFRGRGRAEYAPYPQI